MTRRLRKINQADVAIYPIDARGLMLGAGASFDIMNQFAETTGGQAYYNGNDVAGAVERADRRFEIDIRDRLLPRR